MHLSKTDCICVFSKLPKQTAFTFLNSCNLLKVVVETHNVFSYVETESLYTVYFTFKRQITNDFSIQEELIVQGIDT
jgi:hypothetical protein